MRIAVACALIAGCSDTPTVAIQLVTQPSTISFRPDRGDWTTVPEIARSLRSSTYEIPEQDGTIAIACKRADGSFHVEELSATAAELTSELYAPVVPWPQLDCAQPTGSGFVEVSGSALDGGVLYIGDMQFPFSEDSSYLAEATIGVHDVVVANSEFALIRHDQPMLMPYVEPTIALQAQGVGVGSLMLEDELGDSLGATSLLVTVNGTRAQLPPASFGAATVVPAELLEPGDTQVVVTSEQPTGFGALGTFASEAFIDPNQFNASVVAILDVPDGATFGSDVSVDFSNVNFDAAITDFRVEYSTQAGALAATATAGWIASHTESVAFDSSFPDFAGPIGPDADQIFSILQRGSGAGVVLESKVCSSLCPPAGFSP
jgi:hypothetical protein